MKRILALVLAILLRAVCPIPCAMAEEVKEEVKDVWVDFSHHTGVPLFKRQNIFTVSYSFGLGGDSRGYLMALPTLRDLRSESMRVDLGMGAGGLGKLFAQGSIENMRHEFSALDELLKLLYKNGTQPYFSYGYMPELLQPEDGDFRSAPVDFEAWKQLCSDIAKHYEAQGWPLGAHEIWNEPDLGTTFYNGTWEDFIKMYDYGVRGIREANPNATVGGMSLAFARNVGQAKIDQFLTHVAENDLPMDFLSYHNYGTAHYLENTKFLNGILSQYGNTFDEQGLHINEFHVSESWSASEPERCNSANMACLAMQAISKLVDMPTVTSVNWATWRDEGLGLSMLNLKTSERSAVYHALKVYNEMPIDRIHFSGTRYINGLASIDEQAAGVILYTRSVKEQQVKVHLNHLPFDLVDVQVYAIDAEHSSVYDGCTSDELQTIDFMTNVSSEDLIWTGTLGARGMLYLRVVPSGQNITQKAVWSMEGEEPVAGDVATVIRKEYYFEDRSSTMFSEFDLGTFTAWAGMGNRATGLSKGAVLLQNLPEQLTIMPHTYGDATDGAGYFLYAQYTNVAGETVLQKAWCRGKDVWQPEGWDVKSDPFSLNQTIILNTPENFGGTLKLIWGIQNAGMDVTLKLSVDK